MKSSPTSERDNELPTAYATPIPVSEPPATANRDFAAVVASVSSTSDLGYITCDLPPGVSGIQLTGNLGSAVQIQIAKLDTNNSNSSIQPGMYVHSIQLNSDLAVSHLNDSVRAQQLLDANIKSHRRLKLDWKPPGLNATDGFYYCHTLPTPASLSDLQIKLTGFPPRVTSVLPKSPLANKLHPQQVVVAVHIPGRPSLTKETPGFTAFRVQQELETSQNVEGIQIIVKEELIRIKKEKGSSAAFDDCIIM